MPTASIIVHNAVKRLEEDIVELKEKLSAVDQHVTTGLQRAFIVSCRAEQNMLEITSAIERSLDQEDVWS